MQDAEAEMGLLQAWGTEPTKMQSEALSSKRREMELDQTGEQGGKGRRTRILRNGGDRPPRGEPNLPMHLLLAGASSRSAARRRAWRVCAG